MIGKSRRYEISYNIRFLKIVYFSLDSVNITYENNNKQ